MPGFWSGKLILCGLGAALKVNYSKLTQRGQQEVTGGGVGEVGADAAKALGFNGLMGMYGINENVW